MTAIAINGARQTVAAPVRRPRRFGLFSAAELVDGGDSHWMLGGLTADGEECSKPSTGVIVCGPAPAKGARSWYSDVEGDPWLAYMYETCKTVGRFSESLAKTRARFEAAEQSAAERGFQTAVLEQATPHTGAGPTLASALGWLEGDAAQEYGGQVIIHMSFAAAAEASRMNLIERYGDHLETMSGNVVVVGNYAQDDETQPIIWATGTIVLYRSPISESGPAVDMGNMQNDYYTLVERAYAALIDCYLGAVQVSAICGCGDGAPI